MNKQKSKEEKKVINATVINEDILTKAVKDYLSENKIIPKESINFSKIKVLSLSFLNIWKIQYLDSLVRLEKLQLDNNVIEKIENVDHLVNLKWLDLSFNNIKKIQGLESLVNLTDLSLYNNHVSFLDGLENCSKLNIFSIGNNQIRSFEQIIAYFGRVGDKKTRFKYLQVLNVYGNPFTMKEGVKDQQYEYHLVSHLPNLRYLDYIFIDEKRRKEIRDFDQKFRTEDQGKFLQQLKIEQEKEKEQQQQKKKKQNAKMNLMDGFSDEIVKIDDLQKITKMRGLQEEIQKFTLKVKELVESMQKRIKDQNQKKLAQIKKSEKKLQQRENEAEKKSMDAIYEFEGEYKNSIKIIENKEIHKNWREEVKKIEQNILKLKSTLLNIEIELIEDAESLFKKEIMILIQEENKKIQSILSEEQKDEKGEEIGFFKKIQDQIKDFGNKLEKISKDQMDRYTQLQASGEAEQQYGDGQLQNILANKDSVPGLISSIKEMLLEKKSKKESQIDNELCSKDKEAYKKQYEERQYERNRKNIKNINKKIDQLNRQLKAVLQENDDD